ncbi:MAG: outer membrane beta-barrel protein [Saprospiraceae bacterium]|nr:outer membrane beta-barrel protein [Saprospiraceae bacterium]
MKQFSLSFFVFLSTLVYGQTFNITGKVTDTLNNPLVFSSVMLLEMDSTLVDFSQTDIGGFYDFKKVQAGSYIVKATYLGYIPVAQTIQSSGSNVKVETLRLTEIATELMEVVIKAAKAPMKMRGDTIEYDASTFKVPQGSSIEDLLRRLPGMEVDQDGTLRSDGKDITKVTVEGKDFFGGDPKAVTKNLPAEGVSKVQVFDKKTEEEKLTGIKSNSDQKEMNITLKDEFKKGGFGKVIAGGGSVERGEIKGNYNKFNDKHQFSLVGVANNTGRNGLNWDDYQDFMGAQSFNFDNQLSDYGFGGNGMRMISFGGSNSDDIENKISSTFFSGNNGGFPKSVNTGVNYNYDHNKTKIGSRYFYNYSGNESQTSSQSTNFFNAFTSSNDRLSTDESAFSGHRGELSFERALDSLHTIVINSDFANVISKRGAVTGSQILRNGNELTSSSDITNDYRLGGNLYTASALLRKSFKKKGRFFGANLTYLNSSIQEDKTLLSAIKFYNNGAIDSVQNLNQVNQTNADKNSIKTNVTFSEPLGKKWFASVFGNYSYRKQNGVVDVKDVLQERSIQNEFLSRNYENTVSYFRTGTTLTYANNGLNVSVGGGFQQFDLLGNFAAPGNSPFKGTVDQTFKAWLPYTSLNYSIGRTANIGMGYTKDISEPGINDLLPVVDNSNPLYIREGNQNLLPENMHNVRFNFNKSFPVQGIRFYAQTSATFYDNQIIQKQEVDENLITRTQPINYDGGNRLSTYFGFSFPIIKTKIKSSINLSNNINKSFAFVNANLNETNTISYRPSINLDITPFDDMGLYINYSLSRSATKYNINTSQNQNISQDNLGVQFNTKVYKKLYLASSYTHSFYKNDRFGDNVNVPIVNGSIYLQVLKGNKGEIRFSIYDALNKNVRFSQFAGSNSVSQSLTTSLARYAMVTFTYNIRGVKSEVQRDSYY